MIDVMAIVGPTASGKTALSLEMAKRHDGEIINGDSMQVYRGLSIGTAKIEALDMDGVVHHLLDIKDPKEPFSVAEYQQLVRGKIAEIKSRGKFPIIVGGSGLYVQAVLFDYRFSDQQADEELRENLAEELKLRGPGAMHEKLLALDPDADIHPNNTRRVLRAIEINMGGQAKEERTKALSPMYNELIVGLDIPRPVLYERINERVEAMLQKGLLEEVKGLYDQGIRGVQSVQAIGYKEIYAYFDGQLSLDDAISKIKQNSRKYAKRQFTYFKNKLPIFWIDALEENEKKLAEIEAVMQEKERGRRIQLIARQIKE